MIRQPKISVIIPVYNSEKYLEQCLKSVSKQSLKDIEIICVNDASRDNSLNILNEFVKKDKRIKIFSIEHSGTAAARNFGINVSKGEFLLFLDSDDFFEREMCKKIYKEAKTKKLDILAYKFDEYNSDNEKIKTPPDKFTIYNFIAPQAFTRLFSREFIVNNGFCFQDLNSCNDISFNVITLFTAKNISSLNEIFVHYRSKSQTNISSQRGKNSINIINALIHTKNKLIELNKYEQYQNSFIKIFRVYIKYELLCCTEEQKNKLSEYAKKLLQDDWAYYKDIFLLMNNPV